VRTQQRTVAIPVHKNVQERVEEFVIIWLQGFRMLFWEFQSERVFFRRQDF